MKQISQDNLLFALDIGTRNIVGIVAEKKDNVITILAVERHEHKTRAMLDGQIHDVPQVVQAIQMLKKSLETKAGVVLTKVAVAAAGRALLTIKADAELVTKGLPSITKDIEKTIEIAAIQEAQNKLAQDNNLQNTEATGYYCVGYSVCDYHLDGTKFISLVGQSGNLAQATIIATFLPRQVVDSIQTALAESGLEMSTMTLEPIAAINVLIPQTMRHLNLALVDIGAGTSDVAITAAGSVTGFGMVPSAGDEITEALSQKYLLDFNVAEVVKRQIGRKTKTITFKDILGMSQKASIKDLIASILPNVTELSQLIAKEILLLNQRAPQAILLIGGGALTPELTQELAKTLDIPVERIGIREPEAGRDFTEIPEELMTPEAITPLGILKLADSESLNFISITVNDEQYRLFNLGKLKVLDGLLVSGIDARLLKSKPGLGFAVTINGNMKFIAGKDGKEGKIELNGKVTELETELKNGDKITITKGTQGTAPIATIRDVVSNTNEDKFTFDDVSYPLVMQYLLNDQIVDGESKLKDRDSVVTANPKTIGEAFQAAGLEPLVINYNYTINDEEVKYKADALMYMDGRVVTFADEIFPDADIVSSAPPLPNLEELLALTSTYKKPMVVYFCEQELSLDCFFESFSINDKPVTKKHTPMPGDVITHKISTKKPTISDVLAATTFDPMSVGMGKKINILLNDEPTDLITYVKGGDRISFEIKEN